MSQDLTLADWLTRLEALNINSIDLGLDRVGAVRDAMGLIPPCPVITVAGTNGKGSVCAMLSTILHAAGYRVGTFTSPHLLAYNERVAIDLKPASDAQLAAGFAAVEAGRGDTRLTYFEFSTLAAMHAFISAQVDVIVLEVGLGGRLDATNAFDPSCAVLTSVDLDHQDWLGGTREAIGREKAGIFRAATPAICADPRPPRSVIEHAEQIGARLLCLGQDFGFAKQEDSPQWNFWLGGARRSALPIPALRGGYQLANASAALAALLHWAADESSDWIKGLWGRAGRPAREAVLPWLTDARGFAKDLGEMAFYLLLAMVAITLLTRLLPYKPWRLLHRAMPLVFLALTLHTVALMPLTFWALPLGLLMGTLLALGVTFPLNLLLGIPLYTAMARSWLGG